MITKRITTIILYVIIFYCISLTLGFFSSYVYSKKNYNFRFPLFITSMQNFIHYLLSIISIYLIKYFSRKRQRAKDAVLLQNKNHSEDKNKKKDLLNGKYSEKLNWNESNSEDFAVIKHKNIINEKKLHQNHFNAIENCGTKDFFESKNGVEIQSNQFNCSNSENKTPKVQLIYDGTTEKFQNKFFPVCRNVESFNTPNKYNKLYLTKDSLNKNSPYFINPKFNKNDQIVISGKKIDSQPDLKEEDFDESIKIYENKDESISDDFLSDTSLYNSCHSDIVIEDIHFLCENNSTHQCKLNVNNILNQAIQENKQNENVQTKFREKNGEVSVFSTNKLQNTVGMNNSSMQKTNMEPCSLVEIVGSNDSAFEKLSNCTREKNITENTLEDINYQTYKNPLDLRPNANDIKIFDNSFKSVKNNINYKNIITSHQKKNQDTSYDVSPEICENYKNRENKKSTINIRSFVYTTLPCAISAAIDIGLSSHALRNVSLAFYTMIKSSAPVFVLLSGFLFGIEKPSIALFLTIFTIGAGIFLTTIKKDTVTNTVNLCLSMTTFSLFFASFMGGFRWAFVQYLIEKRSVSNKSILYTIKELSLPIGIVLFIFSCYFEGFFNIVSSEFFRTNHAIKRNIGFIALSGCLSFLLIVSEFLLVSKTSVVFLSVSGIVKELLIVFISVCRKEISFDAINYGGLIISIIGMLLYNFLLFTKRRKQRNTDDDFELINE
ncbi:hypothetical protein EDEG_03460 [Edhazardia aedis USNM 41457]|uniref:Sugar phosphate transporter domain-containing protein n=1 Tax=Edhazardia aedis (strain USNM 41457) TaxID=1003232 RepID=J9DHM0_EDHAE|nr:hypothetical protein EDEG_03460 [Edhazardia aedis USNM 41457]|eukprot:EJW02100.1 hypothetical protein EDEG_03460 [Edhazardia aedis USNM 41457]